MNILDIRTILIGFVVSDILCALVIGYLWLANRRKFAGLALWTLDFALQFLSILLLSLRGAIPDFLSMVVGNSLAIAGAIILLIGLEQFLGTKGRQAHNWAMLAIYTLVHAYFSVVRPVLAVRNINTASALIFICIQCAWLLLSKPEPSLRKTAKVAAIVFSLYCLVSAIGVVHSLSGAVGNDYMKSGTFDAAILLADQMLFIALTFSLSLMVNKRLSSALDEDIEARKRTEQELRISESKFRGMFENMAAASCLDQLVYEGGKAVDYIVLDINPAFEKLIGVKREEAVGNRASRLYCKAGEKIPFFDTYVKVAETGVPEFFEAFFPPIGRYLQVTASCPGKGKFQTVFTDISERKEMESRNEYLASFPALNLNPVLEIGTDGTVRYANPAAIATLERLGLPADVHQYLSDSPEELAQLSSACAQGPLRQEFQLGEAYFLRDVSSPSEGLLRVYLVDITKRKLLEQQIRELNTSLDQRIEQRTAELSLANKELEAFGYSVSHDLRAPLRSIDGFSHALLDDYGALIPAEGRAYLDRIRNAAQRMGQIIEDMLFLSHITRSPLEFQPTDISGMIRSITEELARENPGRKVQWNVESGMASVCDQRLIRIVFNNLLNNAWKFTSMSPEAVIQVGSFNDGDKGTVFFVRDNGTGFDHRFKDKLFTAFQRLHAQTEYPGTGIGLASVKRAVQRHGGEVWAEGEIGKGAVFYFSIPALTTSASAKEAKDCGQ